jgi:hypothetical protein
LGPLDCDDPLSCATSGQPASANIEISNTAQQNFFMIVIGIPPSLMLSYVSRETPRPVVPQLRCH